MSYLSCLKVLAKLTIVSRKAQLAKLRETVGAPETKERVLQCASGEFS
jgi:hypothetical protein